MHSLCRALSVIGMAALSSLAQALPPPAAALPAIGRPATGNAPQPGPAAAAAAVAPAAAPAAIAPPVETAAPGSLSGRLLLRSGAVPRQGVVYLEGVAAAFVPREKVVLSQRGGHFSPEFLVIAAGQAVVFSNDDRLTHSVFSVSPAKSLDLGHAAPGDSRSLTFERPGIVEIFCNIHQTMQAVIVVAPSSHYSQLASDGSYQLGSVPAGRYRLVGYAPQGGQLTQSVEVKSRERTVVNLKLGQAGPDFTPPRPR